LARNLAACLAARMADLAKQKRAVAFDSLGKTRQMYNTFIGIRHTHAGHHPARGMNAQVFSHDQAEATRRPRFKIVDEAVTDITVYFGEVRRQSGNDEPIGNLQIADTQRREEMRKMRVTVGLCHWRTPVLAIRQRRSQLHDQSSPIVFAMTCS